MAEDNVIYIGKKPTMNYVLAVVTQFSMDEGKHAAVVIKARGMSMNQAIDVAEIVKSRFVTDTEYDDIKIGTENLQNKEGKNKNVSFIEITLKKK